jgi:adenosylhomocysteinase
VEINSEDLDHLAVKQQNVKPDIEEFVMNDGRKVYLLAEGRLVNLAGERGQGHPAEIMDLSFAMQALSAKQLVETQMEIGGSTKP